MAIYEDNFRICAETIYTEYMVTSQRKNVYGISLPARNINYRNNKIIMIRVTAETSISTGLLHTMADGDKV